MQLNKVALSGPAKALGSSEKLPLAADEVHIWSASLSVDPAIVCACWDLLSEEETRVALGYRFATDRRQFVVTRGLLRAIVARYVDCSPDKLGMKLDCNGKPTLPGVLRLHVSVSHSRGQALLAFARRPIGIDLEYMDAGALRQEVIHQALSSSEQSVLRALPPHAQHTALYRCWTRKEAILKAMGVGLVYSVACLNVLAANERHPVIRVMGRNWLLRQVSAPGGYAASAAIEQSKGDVKWRQWNVNASTWQGVPAAAHECALG